MQEQRLMIRVGQGSLSFAFKNVADGAYSFFQYNVNGGISMAANLREALRDGQLRLSEWRKVQVLLDSPVVMVPIDEYDEHSKELLYNYSVTGQENNAVLATILPQVNAVALYSMNKDLRLVLADNFSDIKIHPVCGALWQYRQRRSLSGGNEKLYCYFHDGKLEVCSFRKNRFRFVNSFKAAHAGDAAYFILSVWKQLAMDGKKDDIYVAGSFCDSDALMQQLRRFVGNVYKINASADFNRHPLTLHDGVPFDMVAALLK